MLEGDEGWVDGCCGCMEAAALCCCGLGSNWMTMQTTPFLSFQWCSVSSSTLQAMLLPCLALPCMGASPAQPVAAEHCCLSGVSCPASWPSHLVTSFPRIERLRPELLPAWAKQQCDTSSLPGRQPFGTEHRALVWLCPQAQSLAVEVATRPALAAAEAGRCSMGSLTGRRDERQEPICTRKAMGPAQAYWQALLAGDRGTLAEVLSSPQHLSPNAVFDTSNLEEWKDYRFNFRRLSMWGQRGLLSRRSEPFAYATGRYCCWDCVSWVLFWL